MRKTILVVALLIAVFSSLLASADEPSLFTKTVGYATKTGFRGVFAWEASEPVRGTVRYGTDSGNLNLTATQFPAGAPDTAGLAIVDGLQVGSTYYWRVEDQLSGEVSDIKSFKAANAYTDWNGEIYTIDLLVQLDSQSLPAEVPYDLALSNVAQGISIFAERLYDAMDGYARLGKVIITDTDLEYSANTPFIGEVAFTYNQNPYSTCPATGGRLNAADVLIQTSIPFDSHTYSGWAINNPCTSFYVGRLGQLVIPWGQASDEDLHFGYVSTHEMMHYAFNAPDLYPTSNTSGAYTVGCANLEWDGSVMHNGGGWKGSRWELTELDRNPTVTPCNHSQSGNWTWEVLRQRYTNVPAAASSGPVGTGIDHMIDLLPRGHEDGGALDILVLDQTPGASTLESFTPSDAVPEFLTDACVEPGATIMTDKNGDAISQVPAHDIEWSSVAQLPGLNDKFQFTLKVASLEIVPPNTTWPIIFQDAAGGDRFVRMSTNPAGMVSFSTGTGATTNPNVAPGEPADPASHYDADGTIKIVVSASQVGNPAVGGEFTQFLTRILIHLPTAVSIPPPVGLTTNGITPDNMPDSLARSSSYQVINPASCP